jgi:tetratricopeptide (TPR) repeat protein
MSSEARAAIEDLLARARALASVADDEAAKLAYLDVLRHDPANLGALNELGNLALAGGYRSAARTAYQEAIRHHPGSALVRVNLGNLLVADQDPDAALVQYQAALAVDPHFAEAHRGIGTILQDRDPDSAERHLQRAFAAGASVSQAFRGRGQGARMLLLVSARGGNIPVQQWNSDRDFAITALYLEFWPQDAPLPPHALIVNAIGDADRCPLALSRAAQLVRCSGAPIINHPAHVARTGRVDIAQRLGSIAEVIAPHTRLASAAELATATDLKYPLLLRRPGFHTGQHFLRVGASSEMPAALAALAASPLLAIQYLDARGPDGSSRKYRVVFVNGIAYPVHLAISVDWKVHYFTAKMADAPQHREEEQRFLQDMPTVLGPRAMAGLEKIRATLQLDYAGVDFALSPEGHVQLFEANATMVVAAPGPEAIWDYRRAAAGAVLEACREMLRGRAAHGQ